MDLSPKCVNSSDNQGVSVMLDSLATGTIART